MPRNGSGTASIPNSFVTATTISSSAMNQNFTDVASMLTGSVAADGQTPMSGALRLDDGSEALPGLAFEDDTNTGWRRSGADVLEIVTGGTDRVQIDADGKMWALAAFDVAGAANLQSTLAVAGVITATAGIEVGATDTTLARSGAGDLSVEGKGIYRADGTDVPVADGGTGRSTATAYAVICGGTTATGAHQSIASVGSAGQALVSAGAGALPAFAYPLGTIIAIIEDQKNQNTAAQTLSTGSDQVRELTTLAYNRDTLVSLSSNQFTLPAGTWEVEWSAPNYVSGSSFAIQSLLYNATDTAEVARGESLIFGAAGSGDEGVVHSRGRAVVTIAGSKAFEIRHRVGTEVTGGKPANFGTEVYTRVVIRRA